MPFRLKNARATYQCTMTVIFHDLIHNFFKDYVDDILVKSLNALDHLSHLEEVFDQLAKYYLILNPKKCVFNITSRKLLGFIISQHGIKIDPKKSSSSWIWILLRHLGNFSLFKGNYNQSEDSSPNSLISVNHLHIYSKRIKISSGTLFANATLN